MMAMAEMVPPTLIPSLSYEGGRYHLRETPSLLRVS